jgi:alpha-galactosidase
MNTERRKTLSKIICGDMAFQYVMDSETKNAALIAVPVGKFDQIDLDKEYTALSLVQIKLRGEQGYRGLFAAGRTMMNSHSSRNFIFHDQKVTEENDGKTVITYLKNEKNHLLEHHLVWRGGEAAVTLHSVFVNEGDKDAVLEMLSSFSLGGITPFETGDTPNTLVMHRLRSRWADEGKLESIPIEDLQLEPSFTCVSVNSIRFGQTGTMPVREYFPFIAVEDIKNYVSWGAQIAWPGSWQIEAYRLDHALHLSGGLADRDFGHWFKKIKPGERFVSPQAVLSVINGGVDELSQRLTSIQYRAWERWPEYEKSAPAVFNEWCMTWGGVNADSVERAVNRLKGTGIKYFVIDAGWYDGHGSWNPSSQKFPSGLEKNIKTIKDAGLIPGIWFEYECCEKKGKAFSKTEHMLTLDGHVITEDNRHFWDMRDTYVHAYLTEKVINFLKKYKIDYLKIDYNGNAGIGCDGSESPGEGLRQQIEGMIRFIQKIREEVLDVVIENCSSGVHRLGPFMMGLTTMASFSDAHENKHIPIIAANLHRAVLPCQAQIWAVVRPEDTVRRLYYTMSAGLLGRLCLSGDIDKLDETQMGIVKMGIEFYDMIREILKKGFTYWYGPKVKSYRYPEGWQAILRVSEDKKEAYMVVHTFAGDFGETIKIDLSAGYSFELAESFMEDESAASLQNSTLKISPQGEFQGFALKLKSRTN